MKYFLYLFSTVISLNCFSQNIEGFVFDENNNPLPYANILLLNQKKGAYSDGNGYFKINAILNKNDTIQVSSVGYIKKIIPLSSYPNNSIIKLEENITTINEIILNVKKVKYNSKVKLGLKKSGRISSSGLIGYNTTVYIKNPEYKKGKLEKINLYLNKVRKKTSWKSAVFLAKLNIRIYEYDSINDMPGRELLHENLIVQPKNKKYVLKINVKNLNIPFPKNGICIGVEYVDEYNKHKKFEHIGPSLRYTKIIQKPITWSNYRDRGWRDGFMKYGTDIGNLLVNIDVLFPKK